MYRAAPATSSPLPPPASTARAAPITSRDPAPLAAPPQPPAPTTPTIPTTPACSAAHPASPATAPTPKTAPPARAHRAPRTCCSRCAGRYAPRDTMPIPPQANAKLALPPSTASPASTAPQPYPPTAPHAYMAHFTPVLPPPAPPHAGPTSTKILGTIAATTVTLPVRHAMDHRALPAYPVPASVIS